MAWRLRRGSFGFAADQANSPAMKLLLLEKESMRWVLGRSQNSLAFRQIRLLKLEGVVTFAAFNWTVGQDMKFFNHARLPRSADAVFLHGAVNTVANLSLAAS